MNRFLLGALAMGAVFVLTSFALSRTADPAKPTGGPAWTVSQYQLDRAFRTPLPLQNPISFQMPSSLGVIITQLHYQQSNPINVLVTINGVMEDFTFSTPGIMDLNPPLIARPGDNVTFSIGASVGSSVVVFAGYTTLPGET